MNIPSFHFGPGERRLIHFGFEMPGHDDLTRKEMIPEDGDSEVKKEADKEKPETKEKEQKGPNTLLNESVGGRAQTKMKEAEHATKEFDKERQDTDKEAALLRSHLKAEDNDVNLAKDATIVGLYAPDAETEPYAKTETAVEQRTETVTNERKTEAEEEKIVAKESPDTANKLS
ncbi:MAG TPA: hypothetical protein VI873_03405 [Candidatus Peribacteraceae bacterium]|nr:hypothetical protein [Candidatus Peribacteraceae bacterium]